MEWDDTGWTILAMPFTLMSAYFSLITDAFGWQTLPISSPIDTWSILYRFWVILLAPKSFPSVWPGYDDNNHLYKLLLHRAAKHKNELMSRLLNGTIAEPPHPQIGSQRSNSICGWDHRAAWSPCGDDIVSWEFLSQRCHFIVGLFGLVLGMTWNNLHQVFYLLHPRANCWSAVKQ